MGCSRAALVLLPAAPAAAAPDLTLSATHARPTFLRAQAPNTTLYAGTLTLTVANTGADPTDGSAVTVTENAAGGADRAGQQPGRRRRARSPRPGRAGRAPDDETRCTRSDVLAARGGYPPITVTVAVAQQRGRDA